MTSVETNLQDISDNRLQPFNMFKRDDFGSPACLWQEVDVF